MAIESGCLSRILMKTLLYYCIIDEEYGLTQAQCLTDESLDGPAVERRDEYI